MGVQRREVTMQVFSKKSISSEAAMSLIRRAVEGAAGRGLALVVVVVDESGVLKEFHRMDGAPLLAMEAARKKALTAVGFGLATGQPWADFIGSDKLLERGLDSLTDFTMLPGGLPVVVDGNLVGAIGVAGGHYSQDLEVAKYALGQEAGAQA
jgi:uncharacterized protein GlcG (DUF336 family)